MRETFIQSQYELQTIYRIYIIVYIYIYYNEGNIIVMIHINNMSHLFRYLKFKQIN